jgi:bacteriocin-like protein
MKKLSPTYPLEISKETIATLSEEQLQAIEGGAAAGDQGSCIFATCHGTGVTDQGNAAEEATT